MLKTVVLLTIIVKTEILFWGESWMNTKFKRTAIFTIKLLNKIKNSVKTDCMVTFSPKKINKKNPAKNIRRHFWTSSSLAVRAWLHWSFLWSIVRTKLHVENIPGEELCLIQKDQAVHVTLMDAPALWTKVKCCSCANFKPADWLPMRGWWACRTNACSVERLCRLSG